MKKVLFFPIPAGVGPLVNCLSLAEELRKIGFEIAFGYTGDYEPLVARAGFPVLDVTWPPPGWPKGGRIASRGYTNQHTIDDCLKQFGYNDHEWIQHCIEDQLAWVRHFQPDILVHSWSFTVGVVGSLTGIPVVQIFQKPMHPTCEAIQYWSPTPAPPGSTCLDPVNYVLRGYGLSVVHKIEEFTSMGELLLVPTIPELEPFAPETERVYHVGHLTWMSSAELDPPSWLLELDQSKPVIYLYNGGLRHGIEIYDAVIGGLGGTDAQVVISTGMEASPERLPKAPSNIRCERFVPGLAMTKATNVVVSHGAVGIDMCCLLCGVPNVMIPTSSEREYYARAVADQGAGILLDFQSLSPERLKAAVKEVLATPVFREKATLLGQSAESLGGAQRAAQLVSQLCREDTKTTLNPSTDRSRESAR